MIFGFVSALGWGVADFLAAVASRRIGSLATVVVGQVAAFLVFVALFAGSSPGMPEVGPGLVLLPVSGVAVAVAYLAFYRGLQLGPVALVSPIGAGYGALSVTLAVILLREPLGGWPAVGVIGALVGIVLTSRNPRTLRQLEGASREGVPYALVAMVGFGVSAFIVGAYSQSLGWASAVLLARTGTVATLLVVAVGSRGRARSGRRSRNVALAVGVGLLDIVAFSSFARASELGLVSIAAAISATYPVVPILAGVALFREVIVRTQWLGIGLTISGLVILGATA